MNENEMGTGSDSDRERVALPETFPKYPESITDPICVACGKTMGEIGVCYGCERKIRGLSDGELEQEMVRAYTRGRAAEYWNGYRSVDTDNERSGGDVQ